MYGRSAAFYDAIYEALGKDYRAEADAVLAWIGDIRRRPPSTLLDVACGTGRHLEYFRTRARCVGVDVEPGLLEVARQRCPDVRFVEADMVRFDLGELFDAVTCLFSSIGYVRTVPALRRAVACMSSHLAPGGVLAVEPWFAPEQWEEGHVGVVQAEHAAGTIIRMMRSGRKGPQSVLDAHYLVGGASGIAHFTERHQLGLFTTDDYVRAFEGAGLHAVTYEQGLTGRGMVLGTAQ